MPLILAFLWLGLTIFFFVWYLVDPDNPRTTFFDTGIPVAALALCLFVYSIVRWWSVNQRRQSQQTYQDWRRERTQKPREDSPFQGDEE